MEDKDPLYRYDLLLGRLLLLCLVMCFAFVCLLFCACSTQKKASTTIKDDNAIGIVNTGHSTTIQNDSSTRNLIVLLDSFNLSYEPVYSPVALDSAKEQSISATRSTGLQQLPFGYRYTLSAKHAAIANNSVAVSHYANSTQHRDSMEVSRQYGATSNNTAESTGGWKPSVATVISIMLMGCAIIAYSIYKSKK